MGDRGPDFVLEGTSDEEEVGLEHVKRIAGLFLRSPRRHPRLAVAAALLPLALGILVALFWPRSYECSVRLLAQRNLILPALGNPSRAVPREADSPTHNAVETILQRDNLVAAIHQLDLLTRWEATRQPILRLKDRAMGVLFTRTDDDKLRDMIGLLEKRLQVQSDESTITIEILWPDRDLAYEIVTFLQKNFLEARYDTNVNVVTEAIRILQERAQPQAAEVDAALADLTKIEADRRATAPAVAGAGVPRGARRVSVRKAAAPTPQPTASPDATGDDTDDAAAELEDVRRRLRLVKEDRDRQLMLAQNQLADARATLGPLHPTVVALNEKISQLAADPPELRTLAARERQLVAQLAKPSVAATPVSAPAPLGGGDGVGGGTGTAPPASTTTRTAADLRDDPEVALALTKLQAVTAKYNDLLSRIEAANIELEVTRAAFKYQYTVVRPAELARKPSKPNVLLVLVATLLATLVFLVLVPGLLDLVQGRFVEPWQVEQALDLPLLGELNRPS